MAAMTRLSLTNQPKPYFFQKIIVKSFLDRFLQMLHQNIRNCLYFDWFRGPSCLVTRVVIRLKISIMGLKRTFYHPFILSYLSFHVIFNYLWFSFDDLFDLVWCKLYWNSPKTLSLNPLPLNPTLMCF
jgi:hypothetical protein